MTDVRAPRSDYRDNVIEVLALREHVLRRRVAEFDHMMVEALLDAEASRAIAQVALARLHELARERNQQRETILSLRDEIQALRQLRRRSSTA